MCPKFFVTKLLGVGTEILGQVMPSPAGSATQTIQDVVPRSGAFLHELVHLMGSANSDPITDLGGEGCEYLQTISFVKSEIIAIADSDDGTDCSETRSNVQSQPRGARLQCAELCDLRRELVVYAA